MGDGFAQCMQNHDNNNARMACARVAVCFSLDEKQAVPDESDSECVKTCKNGLATTIAYLRSSLQEDETLSATLKLLRSEQRAKLLKERFLRCIKECES